MTTSYHRCLALRADGTWVGWSSNEDGLLDKLDQLKGGRRIAVGEVVAERFIMGIRKLEK